MKKKGCYKITVTNNLLILRMRNYRRLAKMLCFRIRVVPLRGDFDSLSRLFAKSKFNRRNEKDY